VSSDFALWLLGVALEAAIIGLLLKTRIARLLPVFFIFSVWNLLSDVAGMLVRTRYPAHFVPFFMGEISLDSLVQFAVLVELAWSVLRPYRLSLPRATPLALAVLVLLVGLAVWPFTGTDGLRGLTPEFTVLIRLQQTFTSLRILFFLALAGLSQVLAIGWRNRELQVATGLGFYSLVSLAASMLHTHHASQATFHMIDNMVAASYACSLVYWGVSFLQKEAPRQEFSPRMQNLVLTVAGTARSSRMNLEEIRKSKL
jgi:hypothetical protein